MKNVYLLICIPFLIMTCKDVAHNPSASTTAADSLAQAQVKSEAAAKPSGPLAPLSGFLGLWNQVEGVDLVSYEEWKKVDDAFFQGKSWTMYQDRQVYQETIELRAENGEIFYIPNVPENKGPVRFKMTSLEGSLVVFENPEHDFPQKISYEMRGDTMLFATISGTKGGKEAKKEFPLHRVKN